ncbi:unnamed protein product [Lactuca virosa]|uniref:GDSL esterase/lipase n=1 Tax=Lactuca virosa TaxID=75947 RepID=A0AAU9N1X8_9ASTR|nr:unnamed protein product [Lactuca virosa]
MYGNGCYTTIFSFGDSLADTGNIKQIASISVDALRWPYGETFFHQPTGRASNGRLLIDFLGKSCNLGLPLIPPFLHDKEDDKVVEFGQGVNYAVVAATALDTSFHEARGTVNAVANVPLGVQLTWFKKSLPFICSNASGSHCRNLVGRSLILMGEIGGTDYNNPIVDNKRIDDVPLVIDTIISAINELINMGAQTLVVPRTFPIGCSGMILTSHFYEKEEENDNRTGCLIKFNRLTEYHNELLQTKLNHLRELHPSVVIIYADYYNAAMQIIHHNPNSSQSEIGEC